MGVPHMTEKLNEAHNESTDSCIDANELEW